MTKEKAKTFKKLGFAAEEVKPTITALNLLLANYQVHYQKLRDFHWNVTGPDFFDIHEQFEQEYEQVKLNIDEIAERIRVFGDHPISTMKQYLDVSTIEEAPRGLSAEKMVKSILDDFEILLSFMIDTIEEARSVGDVSTSDMVTKMMQRTEKRHWMLTAFSKKS